MGNGNIWRPWRDVDQSLQRFPDAIASSLEAGSAQSLSPPPPSLLLLLLVFSQRPALYLPTFRHLLSVNKLISLSLPPSLPPSLSLQKLLSPSLSPPTPASHARPTTAGPRPHLTHNLAPTTRQKRPIEPSKETY